MARKTKPEIVYRPEAQRDLAGIAVYTTSQWGRKQAILYLGDIRHTIERLTKTGGRQPRFEHIIPELQRARSGHHFIFFVLRQDRLEIIRILHERADQGALLD